MQTAQVAAAAVGRGSTSTRTGADLYSQLDDIHNEQAQLVSLVRVVLIALENSSEVDKSETLGAATSVLRGAHRRLTANLEALDLAALAASKAQKS